MILSTVFNSNTSPINRPFVKSQFATSQLHVFQAFYFLQSLHISHQSLLLLFFKAMVVFNQLNVIRCKPTLRACRNNLFLVFNSLSGISIILSAVGLVFFFFHSLIVLVAIPTCFANSTCVIFLSFNTFNILSLIVIPFPPVFHSYKFHFCEYILYHGNHIFNINIKKFENKSSSNFFISESQSLNYHFISYN